jgi:hypothetical protein
MSYQKYTNARITAGCFHSHMTQIDVATAGVTVVHDEDLKPAVVFS